MKLPVINLSITSKSVYFSLAGNIILLFARIFISSNLEYAFLLWNLFLAYIPFYLTTRLLKMKHKILSLSVFLLSILFLPNAPYIITDFSHLLYSSSLSFWFDLILIMYSAINGLILFICALCNIEKYLQVNLNLKRTRGIIVLLIILCSYGVFVGRFLRWNSWDIFIQPISLFSDCVSNVRPFTIAFSACLAFFLIALFHVTYIQINKEQ